MLSLWIRAIFGVQDGQARTRAKQLIRSATSMPYYYLEDTLSFLCLHAPSVDFYVSVSLSLDLRQVEYVLLHLFMCNTCMVCRWGAALCKVMKRMLVVLWIWRLLNRDIATGNNGEYCRKLKPKTMSFSIVSLSSLSSTAETQLGTAYCGKSSQLWHHLPAWFWAVIQTSCLFFA